MVFSASHTPSLLVAREQLGLVEQYRANLPTSDAPGREVSGGANRPASMDPPTAPPQDDVKALEVLEEKITTLAARIHAATHRLLVLIAAFDRRQGWKLGGHRTCAHWLSFRTGIDLGTAREKVRTARALVELPETSASMSRGELSFSKVRAVTRVATAENERNLLKVARTSTTAQLEHRVRSFKRGSREDEASLDRRRFESRTLSVFSDHEGMYVVRGRLTAEVGALLMRAVEAASDVLYLEGRDQGSVSGGTAGVRCGSQSKVDSQEAAAQRRADALGLLVERALAVGFGGDGLDRDRGERNEGKVGRDEGKVGRNEGKVERDGNEFGQAKRGLVPGDPSNTRIPAPICGTRAERYQVMLHVEAETLRPDGEGGRSELEDGTRISAETSQRLSCDAGLVRVHHAPEGAILDVGRRTRTIPPSLRRALEARDRGCRFPGCGSRFTEGHHVKHWAEGGETSLGNCLLLCRHHHRLVHEGGWRVKWRMERGARGIPLFIDPRGRRHSDGSGKPQV